MGKINNRRVRVPFRGERHRNRRLQRAVRRRDRKCRYCRERVSNTVDHVIPISKGGKSVLKNMVGACDVCNYKKADNLLEECGLVLHVPRVLGKFYLKYSEEEYVTLMA